MPALRRLRCCALDLGEILALPELGRLGVVQLVVPLEPAEWARKRGLVLLPVNPSLPPRGQNALTFARLGSGFWRWAGGFLL